METDGDDKAVNAKMWSCHQVAYFNGSSVNFTVPAEYPLDTSFEPTSSNGDFDIIFSIEKLTSRRWFNPSDGLFSNFAHKKTALEGGACRRD